MVVETKKNSPKIIFFGTPKFGANILTELIKAGFKPNLVITKEDKPVGRKQILTPSPVKIIAEKHKIQLLQPSRLKGNEKIINQLKDLNPDLAIVAAYGLIIPSEILKIPKFGFINVHPSLLPKYRGASPIQFSILEGAKITGVTIMVMDEELDHGPILAQQPVPIKETDTAQTLGEKLSELGANLLIEILPIYLIWKKQTLETRQQTLYTLFLPPKEQDHKLATFTKMLTKNDGFINLEHPPSPPIFRKMLRAFYPWPGVHTEISFKRRSKEIKLKLKFLPIQQLKQKITTNYQFLIQPAGKKPITVEEFINGYPEIKELIKRLDKTKIS